MKVVHISFDDYAGAGLCALRLNSALRKLHIDSNMLVLNKRSLDNSVYQVKSIKYICRRYFNFFLRLIGLQITDMNKVKYLSKRHNSLYTLPSYVIDVSSHPLVKNADIIHLHWINNFIDIKRLLNNNSKPIIWTLHDENLFYGISHYHKTRLSNDPLENKYLKMKEKLIPAYSKLGVVLLSNYFYNNFACSPILRNAKKCVINNSVDTESYKPIEKSYARQKLNISDDSVIIAFVAGNITDPQKGLSTLIDSVKELENDKVSILAVGDNINFKGDARVIATGFAKDSTTMSMFLSAADIFAMPSFQEAFSQAPLEAMACGLPVISFPVSGTEELITSKNGIICSDFTKESLKEGIRVVLTNKYNAAEIREDVTNRFSPESIARQYLGFYKKVQEM